MAQNQKRQWQQKGVARVVKDSKEYAQNPKYHKNLKCLIKAFV